MTRLLGLEASSPWTLVVRRPPTGQILEYILAKWDEYVAAFGGVGIPLRQRTEPVLTEGLGAFLVAEKDANRQPFHGDFFAELVRFDLNPDGTARRVGRTDIEWRLYGMPAFIIEFKIIGGGRPALLYVTQGMARFVDGRYGPHSLEGAMCAFVQSDSSETHAEVVGHILANNSQLRCLQWNGSYLVSPSNIAPSVATFDSLHERAPASPDIALAHIFIDLP